MLRIKNSVPDDAVSDETIRATAVELARPVLTNGRDPARTIKAARMLVVFLAECGGVSADFDVRVWALRQQLDGEQEIFADDFGALVRRAGQLYQYVRGVDGTRGRAGS